MLQPPGAAGTGRRSAPTNRRKTQESPDDVLRHLQRLGPNKKCADCNALGPQSANLTIGSFVCITCSGILRELNHRVKGIGHSSFTVEEADRMKQSSNEEINKVYLARFNPAHEHLKQPQGNSDQQLLRAWIRRKYQDKAWYKDPDSSNDSGSGTNHHHGQQPTIVQIPPKQDVDLLGSFNSPTTATPANDSSWNAFGGSSQQQQQQPAPAFTASFPANFSPQSPTSAFPANFGSSQTVQQQQQQQQQPPQQQPQPQSNFANFPAPNQQQVGFANFQAPDPSQQQPQQQQQQPSFANFNQTPTGQPPNEQHPQQFANFSNQQQPSNPPHPQQQQQPPHQGFATFPQPQVAFQQMQAPDPFANQGFGNANQQLMQQQQQMQAMFHGQQQLQQQPQQQPGHQQFQQSHSMPLPQQQNQQQQFQFGQVNLQQQQQPQGMPAGSNSPMQPPQGGLQQEQPKPQASFPGAMPTHQNPVASKQQQPSSTFSASFNMPGTPQPGSNAGPSNAALTDKPANDNTAVKEGSASIGKSKFASGQLVFYKNATEVCSARIAKVHFDHALDPFYTIVLENGKEKQTDDAHLEAREDLQTEISKLIPLLTPVQLKQVHEFLSQLQITKPPTSSGTASSTRTQPQSNGTEQNHGNAPNVYQSHTAPPPAPVQGGQTGAPAQTSGAVQQQDSTSFIPSPTPPPNSAARPQFVQDNSMPGPQGGQFQTNQAMQQGMPPQGQVNQGQFQPSQGMQGAPPQGSAHPDQKGRFTILPGVAHGSTGFVAHSGMPNPSFGQQQQPAPNQQPPAGQAGASFIPSPPSVNNSAPVHPSGLPPPPLVQPPMMQQQPQQFQQQQPQPLQQQQPQPQQQQPLQQQLQQQQTQQQQLQQFQEMQQQQLQQMQQQPLQFQQQPLQFQQQPPQQFQQQPSNNQQPVAASQPPNGGPTSPMSPKGNPFDFY